MLDAPLETLKDFSLEGISQEDLDIACSKVVEVTKVLREEGKDRWAVRAAFLKALYDDADEYFAQKLGTFREIAAFDNGVAVALKTMEDEKSN
jgi:hypothetical protein